MSIMNGLSAAGAGVANYAASAGLMTQKADLEQQQATLADQLATARETKLQGQQQAFQAGENTKTQAAEMARTALTEGGAAARNAATIAAENQRSADLTETQKTIEQMRLSADPDDVKTAKAIAANPALLDAITRFNQAKTGMGSVFTPPASTSPQVAPQSGSTGATGAVTDGQPSPIKPSTEKVVTGSVNDVLSNPQEDKTYSPRNAIVDILQAPNPNWNADILSQVSPDYRPRVIAMLEGREAPPPANRPNPITTTLLNAAHMIDPTFDESTWTERFKTRQSLASGPIYQNTLALNTAFGHVAQLAKQFANEGNFQSPLINLPANWISETALGNAAVPDTRRAVDTAASEIRRALSGSAGGLTELTEWQKNFPLNGSPSQQINAVKDAAQILRVRMDEMTSQVNTNLGKGIAPTKLLTPTAQKALDFVEGLGTSAASQGSAATPRTAQEMYGGASATGQPANPSIIRYDARGNRITP